jgi:hypothetical protein
MTSSNPIQVGGLYIRQDKRGAWRVMKPGGNSGDNRTLGEVCSSWRFPALKCRAWSRPKIIARIVEGRFTRLARRNCGATGSIHSSRPSSSSSAQWALPLRGISAFNWAGLFTYAKHSQLKSAGVVSGITG